MGPVRLTPTVWPRVLARTLPRGAEDGAQQLDKNLGEGRKDASKASQPADAGRGVDGGGGRGMLDEELHVYIAAVQLFPMKLNFSFIKNADVKVESAVGVVEI